VHAYGVSQKREKLTFRVTGVVITFSALFVAAAASVFGSARMGFGL
jgi:uncharacterized membrane protein YecN with MAPEG domain